MIPGPVALMRFPYNPPVRGDPSFPTPLERGGTDENTRCCFGCPVGEDRRARRSTEVTEEDTQIKESLHHYDGGSLNQSLTI